MTVGRIAGATPDPDPAKCKDGRRVRLLLVHGTWGRGFNPDTVSPAPRWFEEGSSFRTELEQGLSDLGDRLSVDAFLWSGANSIVERAEAAQDLAQSLDEAVAQMPDTDHILVAHSHGGNVALGAFTSMTQSLGRVQLVTLATPFLAIQRRASVMADRLLLASLFVGIFFCSLLAIGSTAFLADAVPFLQWPLLFAIPAAIGLGFVDLLASLLSLLRRSKLPPSRYPVTQYVARSAFFSLIASMLIAVPVFWYLEAGAWALAAALLFPFLLATFLVLATLKMLLYSVDGAYMPVRRIVPPLKILRSRGDEASLALGWGRTVGFMTQIVSLLSMLAPAFFGMLALLVAVAIGTALLANHETIAACLSDNPKCTLPGEQIVFALMALREPAGQIFRFAFLGLAICITLCIVTNLCKAGFGRELALRALNVTVDVYDTPDGTDRWPVTWCRPRPGSALKHSIYDNLDGVRALIDHVACIAASPFTDPPSVPTEIIISPSRRPLWRTMAMVGLLAGGYGLAMLLIHAPDGAGGPICRLTNFLEEAPSAGYSVLVPPLANDPDGHVRARITKLIETRYDLLIAPTCVTMPDGEKSPAAANGLASKRGATIALWGSVRGDHLHMRLIFVGKFAPIEIAVSNIPLVGLEDGVSTQLHALFLGQYILGKDLPADTVRLTGEAGQLDRLAGETDLPLRPSGDPKSWNRIYNDIYLHLKAATWLLEAGKANRDGALIRRSLAHVDRTVLLQEAGDPDGALWKFNRDAVQVPALYFDGLLNRSLPSARAAVVRYDQIYQAHVDERNVGADRLTSLAEATSLAHAQLNHLAPDVRTRRASLGLACQSLVWRQIWEDGARQIAAMPDRADIAAPVSPSQTEVYKLLSDARVSVAPTKQADTGRAMAYCRSLAPDLQLGVRHPARPVTDLGSDSGGKNFSNVTRLAFYRWPAALC
jgi:hypothetical protein